MSKQTASLLALLAIFGTLSLAAPLAAQRAIASASDPLTLPNAPTPRVSAEESSSSLDPSIAPQTTIPQTATPAPNTQTPQTDASRRAQAAAELKAEENQRIAGVIPNFNTVNNGNAALLTSGQKFHLFFKSAFDPYQFALAGIDAGIGQAEDSDEGYDQGLKGFARRYGANFGDNFDGNFWGNAALPSLLHQDPRYFRLGHGSFVHRALYSISTSVRTHGDNGRWQPAYSNLLGNLIGASISNVYYPDEDRGLSPTLERALSVTYQGTFGGLLQELYPDVAQHYKNKRAEKTAAAAAAAATPAPQP